MKAISVKFGQLVKPIKVVNIKAGTTLADFCGKVGITYGAAIRVNGLPKTKGYILVANDLVTAIGAVSGGR